MQKNIFLLYILIVFIQPTFAQNGEANNWYFGENAGITFNNGAPEVLTDGALHAYEGCSTISDNAGNLLFYSNGNSVWDRTHTEMPNGTGLLGSFSSSQSGLIVPHPGNTNLFYLFTLDAEGDTDGLRYSVINMYLNGGFGDVTSEKNILLHTPTSEKITAVSHANGNDIWVITRKYSPNENETTNKFNNFLISNSGLDTTPIISEIGFAHNNIWDTGGYMKVSPDGTKLAVAYKRSEVLELLEFNNATGELSNPIQITGFSSNGIASGIYGLEFSPNNQFLYVSEPNNGIFQFNINTYTQASIQASKTFLIPEIYPMIPFPHAALQLGPDGKIYVAHLDYEYLGVIHNPNLQGNASHYQFEGLYLEGKKSLLGLPPFIQSYFSAFIITENDCFGDTSEFSLNANQTIDSILWDFGDGNTSTLETPIHTYNTSGTFTVSATVTSGLDTSTNTSTVTIHESPIVNSPVTIAQCDDNIDGYSAFNLNEAINEITVNATNETVTFYESQLDAENENMPIPNPTAYINENVSTDSVWARVENSNGCFRTAQINLVVSTTQIPLTFTRDFYECDDSVDSNTTNGISAFNFSNVTTEIEALFPVGQQLVITYYRNLADALAEDNAIVDITNYRNVGYPNTQNIYIRVDSLLDNDCLGLGDHITLHVETVPVANTVIIPEQCDDDGDNMYAFDTSTIQTDIIGSQTNVSVTYTDENGITLPSPLPNPFNTATQTVTVRVTNSTSQDLDGACYDETTIAFVVDAAAVANPIADIMECDDDNDGEFAFDTSTFEATILNGQTGMQVNYTDEDGNLLSSPLPNPFVSETQTITVRVENTLSATCFDETTINLIVNEQPIANTIQDDIVCDDASNDGEYSYTLTDYNTQILDTQSSTIFEVIYFDDLTNAENNVSPLPYTYLSTATSETMYARIHNRNNIDCYAVTSFQIGVSYLPIAYPPDDFVVCDDASNDGEAEFNLSTQNIDILNGQSETENIITFHLSQEDVDDNTDDIDPLFTNTEANQTIYVRVENINNSDCYATTLFNIIVVEQPVISMEENWPICEGDTVEIFADPGFDEYLWSTGETTPSIIVDQTGNYDLTVTNVYGDVRCEDSQTVTVVQSDIAIITNIETVDWSQSNNEVLITVSGNGDYEYSIDGFNYQDSNHFTNLEAGEFLVYVRDKNGCGVITEEVYLMYYPNFFTPNNDSYNDYWQLHGSKNEPSNKIYIYDRYGKLLKQLSPKDIGWDGTYNGNPLPTSDYWFLLERQNGKQYQGHFTLKR